MVACRFQPIFQKKVAKLAMLKNRTAEQFAFDKMAKIKLQTNRWLVLIIQARHRPVCAERTVVSC